MFVHTVTYCVMMCCYSLLLHECCYYFMHVQGLVLTCVQFCPTVIPAITAMSL